MKLAEALMERTDVQKRIDQMAARLSNNAKVQEGEAPAEAPEALLDELAALVARQEALVTAINLKNSATTVEGEPLTALLARRDAWQRHVRLLRDFLNDASCLTDRASRSEIRIVSTVNVAALQAELDRQSKRLRMLDAAIQAANWTTDIDV